MASQQARYTFLLFLVSLNILLAIIVESFLRVKQASMDRAMLATNGTRACRQETDERREVRSICQDMFCLAAPRLIDVLNLSTQRSEPAILEARQ